MNDSLEREDVIKTVYQLLDDGFVKKITLIDLKNGDLKKLNKNNLKEMITRNKDCLELKCYDGLSMDLIHIKFKDMDLVVVLVIKYN